MKVTTFGKIAISAGAAALLVGGFATSAQADPAAGSFGTLVGVGSDTTQDVVNALAAASNGLIGSYDATGHGTPVQVRADGSSIPRASGSGAGINELRVAIGQTASATGTALSDGSKATIDAGVVGKVDFARSSSGPAAADQTTSGALAYVPFARDAVDVAYADSAKALLSQVPFFVGTASSTTDPSLYNIYRGDVNYLNFDAVNHYVSASKTAETPAGGTSYLIQPLLPKAGSGTRSYFLGQLKITDAGTYSTISGATPNSIKDVAPDGTTPLEEHDGTGIQAYTNAGAHVLAIAPFSIGQWVAQANNATTHVTDRRHDVDLATLGTTASNGVAATTGAGPYATNTAYSALVRDVYNVVPSALADAPTSNIAKAFVGTGSFVCSAAQAPIISAYGFLPLTASSASETCGYTGLRAYARSASTTTVAVPASALVGSQVTATASVVSVNNLGGQVQFLSGSSVLATANIAGGVSSASASFTASAVGAVPVRAQFIPAVSGVASSVSAPVSLTVAGSASTTSISVPKKLAVNKTAKVKVTIAGADALGGTVALKSGSKVVGTAKVAAGSSHATVSFKPAKTKFKLAATYTPKSGSVLASTSSSKTVKAAKGKATITFAKKAVKAGAKAKITIGGVVKPTGTVTVKRGTTVITSKAKVVKGKVSVSVTKLKVGVNKVTVTYNGNKVYKTTKKAGSIKVKA